MQLSIRNAAGRSELVEKQTAGRTVLRLKQGDRLEIVDPATGATPAGVKAHRGGASGNDLIIESFGETVLIEGFFEQTAQGEETVAVEFPGGAAPEITPAMPELAMPGAVLDTGFAMTGESAGYMTMAQASGAAVSSGGASAGTAAASGGAAAAATSSNLWWIAGGIAGAGAAGAAIEHNSSDDDNGRNETPQGPASFQLVRSTETADEGDTVTFTLNTTNVAPGTQYSYTISGVSAGDVQGGSLTGIVTIDANGRAVIQVTLTEDLRTEGVENLSVTVAGQSATIAINDVSTTPEAPTFTLAASSASVDEGQGVSFTLNTTNVAPGAQYSYTISGISPDDIVGGAAALTGVVTIDAHGRAVIEIQLAADATTEGLETLTFEIAGQTVTVNVNDGSVTPAFGLTAAQDNVVGTSWDDTINGSHLTYTTGDVIDGGAGHDQLNLTLPGGTLADGVKVSNVEQVNVQAPVGNGGVELSMTGFDSSVTRINIDSARADVTISDQQSLAAVSITDVSNNTITLDYDSQVVAGDADKLALTVDEFIGALNVDKGIEAIDVQVNDGVDEASSLVLTAEGATNVKVSGGIAGQAVAFDIAMNGERAAGATFDATQFAGDVVLTNIGGGSREFAYAIEFTQGLQEGETATLTIDGVEYSVTADSGALSASELVDAFLTKISGDYWQNTQNELGSNGHALIIYGLRDPASVQALVADVSMTVRDTFDYSDFGGTSSDVVAPVVHTEISNLSLGAGNDTVVVGGGMQIFDVSHDNDITYGDTYDLGDGDNTLAVIDGDVHGTVRFGAGNGTMAVGGDIGGGANVSFGAGDSVLAVSGDIQSQASVRFESGNNTVTASNVGGSASIAFNGDGDNTLDLELEIQGFIPVEEYGSIGGNASVRFNGDGNNRLIAGEIMDQATVTFGDGDNTAETDDIQGTAKVTFGDGDNVLVVRGEDGDITDSASVTFGNGDNQLRVEGDIRGEDASVTFGDGANTVEVWGSVRHASLEFGDGNNELAVGGEMQSATVNFGAGDNTVEVDNNLHFSTLTFGDGANTVTVGEELRATSVEFGSGDDVMSIGTAIRDGSQLEFGAGNDTLNLGDGGEDRVHLHGGDDATVVDLGEGDDTVTIVASSDGETDTIVRSGASLQGGEGNDTLTVKAVDSIEALVARTQEQRVELTFDGDYAVDQVVSVTINGVEYSYTVKSSDIVQGDASGTRANVASGVLTVIQQDLGAALTASTGESEDTLLLEGEVGHADVTVSTVGISSEVTRIANAGISGFETLNLVAVNPDKGEDGNDDDNSSADFNVDFSLIEGVEQINLSSEVTLRSDIEAGEGIVNGVYTNSHAGDAVAFTLTNLPAGLGEHISVAGNEVTATGNRQVERIFIGNGAGDHEIGDVITLEIDDVKYSITVTADDLSGATAQEDADKIAARLAEVVQAGETGFTVARDGNVLTLIGSSDENVDVELDSDGDNDNLDQLQEAEVADDHDIDVSVTAVLDKDVDTEDDTLALTVKGTGDFDLGLDGAWDGFSILEQTTVAYENLSINVQDEFSHYIDTDENDDNREFRGSIALAGGVAGASIVIDDVMAKEVTSTSAANVTVVFDSHADQDENYEFTVSTQGGDDLVDMAGVVLSSHSEVDLGEGVDRLIIGNGREAANEVMSGSAPSDEGRMFRNVSNVEELEFHGEDAITFDDDAFEAGFEKLIVGEESELLFKVGDEFARDLDVEIEDDVEISMEVYNDHAITVTAEDRLDAKVVLDSGSTGDFTLTAEDEAEVDVQSNGSNTLDITLDDEAKLKVKQSGDGDVTLAVDGDSELRLEQRGLGAVAVTAGLGSEVSISFGEDSANTETVSVTQTGSDKNEIRLAGVTQAQNVTVDITVHGHEEDTLVGDIGDTEKYNTNLELDHSDGGIDKLVLRSDSDRGASNVVAVVVEDNWAVAGSDSSAKHLTIDASAVVANEVVLINASQENEANLLITGAATSANVLLGGAGRDSLKGGAGADVLQGDQAEQPQITQVTFEGLYDTGDVISLTINGETITITVWSENVGGVTGEQLAEAFAGYINTGYDNMSDYLPIVGNGELGSVIKASYDGGVLTLTGVENGVDHTITAGVDNSGDYGAITSDQDVEVETLQDAYIGGIASDTLEGGEGADVYVFQASQFDTMDTIVGLNLGGATLDSSQDMVALGGYLPAGSYDALGESLYDIISYKDLIEIDSVVNGGEAVALTGADLQSAVATLFQANGWFETSGSAATNAAGLFNYGEDTYLIAVGDEAGSGFGSDDYIIKVTGATGMLDVSDFYQIVT